MKLEPYIVSLLEALGISHLFVSVTFISSSDIKDLNKNFRGKDSPTDVLSFPQMEFDPLPSLRQKNSIDSSIENSAPETLGDIIICPEIAIENAKSIGQPLDREVAFLIIHGLLHLCGYDHILKDEEKVMLDQQKNLWEQISQKKTAKTPVWAGCIEQVNQYA